MLNSCYSDQVASAPSRLAVSAHKLSLSSIVHNLHAWPELPSRACSPVLCQLGQRTQSNQAPHDLLLFLPKCPLDQQPHSSYEPKQLQ